MKIHLGIPRIQAVARLAESFHNSLGGIAAEATGDEVRGGASDQIQLAFQIASRTCGCVAIALSKDALLCR
jgi:hypothetical protein